MTYPDGVIDSHLPGNAIPLPPDFALQNPQDWLTTLEFTAKNVLQKAASATHLFSFRGRITEFGKLNWL